MIETDFDRLAMLNDFGELVEFNPSTDLSFLITAIFDNQNQIFSTSADLVELSGPTPMLTCRTSDIESVQQLNNVKVRNKTYKVQDVQPDGTGITKLVLTL